MRDCCVGEQLGDGCGSPVAWVCGLPEIPGEFSHFPESLCGAGTTTHVSLDQGEHQTRSYMPKVVTADSRNSGGMPVHKQGISPQFGAL